jgi:Fuc2NAc and GlcNAc transferase
MVVKFFLLSVAIFLSSALGTWLVRTYTLRKSILDIPNERSSHQVPTPRGGGIAIVITFLLSMFAMGYFGTIPANLVWALAGGGMLIALIGFLDDVYSVTPLVRFCIHFLAAAWAVYWLHGFPLLAIGTWKIAMHAMGSIFAMIGIIWCVNFYNFMDGIDGLAVSEGIFVAIASTLALWMLGATELAALFLIFTACMGGFAIWNWPPAKIFLGDVGSGFIGFVFATLALYTANQAYLPILFWCILLAIFLLDTTFTLIHRMILKKKWYAAHCEHAYQKLISYGATHLQVTMSIILLNCLILLPCAFAILYWPAQSLWLSASIFFAMWIAWWRIKFRRSS